MTQESNSIKEALNEFSLRDLPSLLKTSFKSWLKEDPFQQSAAVAYYAILSLPGLMVLIINSVGAIWGKEIVAGRLNDEIGATLGPEAASAVQEMVANSLRDDQSVWATILGIAILIYGATGVFYQLQLTLNQFWKVKTNPKAGWKRLVIDRAQSFGFILVIGFLLLISMVLTTGINVLDEFLQVRLENFTYYLVFALNGVISLGIITGLFALMFKFLPDAQIRWKTVWIGAFLTAILFTIGKWALGVYFGASEPASAYGAAGSIILILLWVSYSSLILFFGAKFTYMYAERYGHGVIPAKHAVKIEGN